jgi:hypothetical protein
VWVEQAIFTSLPRRGRDGYHLVSRSRGIGGADAQSISTWSPSHGSLIVDEHNRVSINFHPLAGGRFALSRSCEGPPEYSGRGGRQLFTHVLVLDVQTLRAVAHQPFALYRNAMALGCLVYQVDPPTRLEPVKLPAIHTPGDPESWTSRAAELGFPAIEPLRQRILSGVPVRFAFHGDRIALAECLVGSLAPEVVEKLSFATSLRPSSVRPFVLSLIDVGTNSSRSQVANSR